MNGTTTEAVASSWIDGLGGVSHVLDREHAAGFLRRDRTGEAQHRREDEQDKTNVFGFHCFLPRRGRA